jgi:hypothetical protein
MIKMIHGICGEPAYLVTMRPTIGVPTPVTAMRALDGSPVTTPIRVCGSCGKKVDPFECMPEGGSIRGKR